LIRKSRRPYVPGGKIADTMKPGFRLTVRSAVKPKLANSAPKVHLASHRLWPDDLGRIAFAFAGARSELSPKID
jgi:hypothetical protein